MYQFIICKYSGYLNAYKLSVTATRCPFNSKKVFAYSLNDTLNKIHEISYDKIMVKTKYLLPEIEYGSSGKFHLKISVMTSAPEQIVYYVKLKYVTKA